MMNPLLQRSAITQWRGWWLASLPLVMGLLGLLWWSGSGHAAPTLFAADPVTAAWEKAKAAGSYHFTSDVLQKTIPIASITNVGRTSRSDALYLEGQTDLQAQTMELTLWTQGGSVLNAESGVSLRTAEGKTFTRRGGRSASSAEPWQESEQALDAFAPQGDFLGYLAAIRNVSAGVAETRNGLAFTRYTFDLDGPAFAAYMHKQLTAAMRAKGAPIGPPPPGVELEVPAYYRDMTGSGELWVGASGLPVRQMLNLRFPEQRDERVEADITVNFSQYGIEQSALWTLLRTGQWQGAWLVLPGRLPDLTGVWLGLALSVLALLVIRYRHVRAVQTALVSAVIASQVVGPMLSAMTQTRFFDSYRAKAAAQEEQQATAQSQRDLQTAAQNGPQFNPHQNPVAAVDSTQWTVDSGQWESAPASPNHLVTQSPTLQVSDPGTDTDGDGLTDFTEVRIGTSEVYSDTDDDGLLDNLEVNGFPMGGQTWYTDPNVIDSNNDGQSDFVEWGINDTTGLPQAAPRDTDSDGLPDLFDLDNDNDGVPDRVDDAPYAKGAATYSEASPLQLTINNLAVDKPTFVAFQLRPQDPKNLWFAYNVLDWPQDSDGQIRDVDGKTYADIAPSQGRTPDVNEDNGDMKLLPMLEIRIPAASANLPSQAELTPFNISVNDFTADGSMKVAYVPLSIVSDPLTGERVAFSGQMRYKPTGSWTQPHSVRLAWVVQGLNDIPCDATAADAAAQGCQSDGYIHNVPSVIHSYYDNWTLAGLGIREENGASMGIVYEDPTVDPNKLDEAPLWGLTAVLDEHFLKPRDTNTDGVRDLQLSDFPTRFDRDSNPTEAQRFGIPNILQVVTNAYAMSDEAAIATAMTETVKILDTAFKPSVQADNNIKPLLLFVQEHTLRAIGLDQILGNEGYATQSGANITFNLAPTAESALSVAVQAMLKWQAYCGADGNNVTWRPCTSDEYAGVIEGRYANAPSLPGDIDPAAVPGRMMIALAYYSTLLGGYAAQVQEGPVIPGLRYTLETENETLARLQIGFASVAPIPQMLQQTMFHLYLVPGYNNPTLAAQIAATTQDVFGNPYYQYKLGQAQIQSTVDNVPVTKQLIKAQKVPATKKLQINFARYAGLAILGSALMLGTNVLRQLPELPTEARTTLGAIGVLVTAGVTVYVPAATAVDLYKHKLAANEGKFSFRDVLKTNYSKLNTIRGSLIVGSVLNVALIWGFYTYAAATSGLAAGSPQLNKAAFEAVAATAIAVLLAVFSLTVIGTIIVGIITLIDTIFTTICELGIDELRIQGDFYGGACFSITTTATKVLAYALYNYQPMVDTSKDTLMTVGAPGYTLANPSLGFVPSNTLTITLPVTTTAVHKDPDPANGLYINYYLWLYSKDNLKSSTFKYGLAQSGPAPQAVDLDQMTDAWQNVTEDHKYVLTPMYSAIARTDPAPLGSIPLVQGINSPVPFDLTMSFAIPAYECFPVLVPVCRTRELENTNTMNFSVLKYDVFPNTLAEFLALGPKADGGVGQRWDALIGSVRDADGDGLNATIFNGLDPDDTTWDADADGLSDRMELELRAEGVAYSPLLRDTDNDGLTDRQEAAISTDPLVADTDNDGLSDGAEVRHQVVGSDGKLTTTWAGGWQVTINSSPARTVWVSSDPFNADGDQDGISDQAEKALAANPNPALRLDDKGVPYHPAISNLPPLAVFTESDAFFGYVAPGQSLQYTSTVVASVPVAPGVLNVSVPAVLGSVPNPARLNFSPNASTSQTLTVVSNFTTAANATSQAITLTSTANTRLPDTGSDLWAWTPATTETALGSTGRAGAFISGVASQPDRQDSYRLLGQAVDLPTALWSQGNVIDYDLRNGTSRTLEVDAANPAWRSNSAPAIACNDLGVCLAVWSEKPGGDTGSIPPRIGAALLAANGTVQRTFAVTAPASPNDGDSTPVVASNGANFLVAWQRLDGYSRQLTPTTSTTAFRTELMTRLYDGAGNAVTGETTLTGDRLEFWSANLSTTSALNAIRSRLNRIDLDWVGDRYRLTRSINLGDAANDPNLLFEDNGAAGSTRLLTWRDVNSSGALITGSKVTVYNDANTDANASINLVYNPSTNEVLLVQTRNFAVLAQQFSSPTVTTAGTTVIAGAAANAVATYYTPQQGYLIGWTDTSTTARPFRYQVRNRFFQVVGGDQQQLTWPVAVNSTVGMALACPAPHSAPTVDLRFEELPGTNGFLNTADFSSPVICGATSCPAAGFAGAPNAPLSDYAVQFDGVDDNLVINASASGSFSVALWMKASAGANAVLVDQGYNQPRGWALFMTDGRPGLLVGPVATGSSLVSLNPLNDGAWHFLVATRNGVTGDIALYVDGVLANSSTGPFPLLDGVSQLTIGRTSSGTFPFRGQIDHFQFYRTVLSAGTVQGLFNRTLQSYCVAAAVPSTGFNFPWSRFSLAEQDLRGGRLTASSALRIQVDSTKPSANLTSVSNNAVIGADQVIGGSASDVGVGVALVEVSVNNGPWQAATGANTWSFSLAGVSGTASLRVRAIDLVGNVGDPSAALNVIIDDTPPTVTITPPTGTLKPTKNANGQWQVPLSGTASDANGIKAGSIRVKLEQTSGVGLAQTSQVASGAWNINYLLDPNLYDPTGSYTVTVQADDNAENRTVAAPILVYLDATGPVAALSATDLAREVITQTLTIGGVISDTNSVVGLDKAEIAFTPIDQIAALPANLTSEQAEAQLNRKWLPVTLAGRGAGVAETTWSVAVPAGLENIYQIDLRGYDLLGNVSITSGLWRGMIDTLDPRVVFTTMPTGASYVDTADNTQRYAVQFLCAVQDRNLDESRFGCPGQGLAEPVRSFDTIPALQTLFPDLTLRTGLALSYTLWTTTTTPVATASACDLFGRCTTTVAAEPLVTARVAASRATLQSAAAGAPFAVVVNPTADSFVAANNTISVTVAAEAGALLKTVAIKLDNVTVETLAFTQGEAVTRTVRTLNLPVATEGQHTLVAEATAWDNSTQTAFFPVTFIVDQNAPTVTLDPSALTIADTWVAQSGVLRFHGNANDSIGLAAVQIKEGDSEFIDATFGGGTWRVALPVADPEGRTLNITVRAIDRVGRITTLNQPLNTELSAVDAPDTSILSGPANPSSTNSASFVVTATLGASVFDCQLDDGPYEPCGTAVSYSDLSKGSHTFRVRALDGRGYPDLSPAEYTWTVNPTALDATITSQPANPSNSRTAQFAFSGTGSSLECSLDGAVFTPCTSPTTYTGLSNGEHTFLVRARSGNEVGAAARYVWTVLNAAPVANGQTVNTTLDTTVAITLTASDDDGVTYRLTQPSNGLLLGVPPAVTYAPNTGFVGTDRFSFVATDGEATSNVATITVTVAGSNGTAVAPTVSIARNTSDIVLSWTPNGANSGYAVHRGTTPSFTPDGTTLLTTLGADATGYTDSGAAPTPSSGYYYVVRAVAGVSTADATTVAALSYALNNAGGQYSLIGLPFLPAGVSDAAGLAATIGNVQALLAWNPATQTMRFFAPPSSGDNFTLTAGMALFVVVNSGGPSSVTLTGVVGPLPQTLTPGGFTFLTVPLDQGAVTSAAALATAIGNVSALLAWNPATQTFRFFTPPSSGDDFIVQPGMPVVVNLPAGSPLTWPTGQ